MALDDIITGILRILIIIILEHLRIVFRLGVISFLNLIIFHHFILSIGLVVILQKIFKYLP